MAEMGQVAAEIDARLREAFTPSELVVTDESHKHAGHAGAREGGESHFHVKIASRSFEGLTRIAIHRAINGALADLMVEQIHALRITATS